MVRILIVDDHPKMLRTVRQLLQEEQGWEICGEARNGEEAVSKAIELKPDVIIMDLSTPKLTGVQAARIISEKEPGARMILFTVRDVDQQLVDEAQSAGIRAVLNTSAHNFLVCAVRVLLQGEMGTFFALTRMERSANPMNSDST